MSTKIRYSQPYRCSLCNTVSCYFTPDINPKCIYCGADVTNDIKKSRSTDTIILVALIIAFVSIILNYGVF